MKITRILSILLCLGMFTITRTSAQQTTGWITLEGQLKGFKNQLELEDMSEFQYLLPPTSERLIIPDSNGNFNIKFKATKPNYYRLGYNIIYLTPGCHLKVSIDKNDFRHTKFIGEDAPACTYLINTPAPKAGSFLEAGNRLQNTPEATIDTIEQAATRRYKELALLKNVTPDFKRLEKARIKADIINSIHEGEIYGLFRYDSRTGKPQHLKGADSANYLKNYRKVSIPKIKAYGKNFTDASLMKLVVYRDVANIVIRQGGKPEDIRKIKDWYVCDSLVSAMREISDKKQLALFNSAIASIRTTAYKNAAEQSLAALMAFGKGDTAADFTAVDQNGNSVNLNSLKGKVIYVDLWATWCGPCMQEMPFFEKLKEKYKENPAIAFVSLSIESSPDPWKKNLEKRKADGYQWLINRYKLNAYNIVGIPRTLVVDKDFKIVEMSAPLPSDPKTIKLLDELSAK
jgi:thiol-disulfide isomerase/thioredoxin